MSPFAFELFVRSMSVRDDLGPEEIEGLRQLSARVVDVPKGTEIIVEHTVASNSCMIIDGLAARAVYTSKGNRQLTALHVPGDFVDLHAFLLKVMDHSVVAMTQCKVAYVTHNSLMDVFLRFPHLGRLFWLSTVIDAAIQRAWTTSLGRRTTSQSIGHLMCEMYLRLEIIGQAAAGRFSLPLTQPELADLLGISIVHVSRKLKELREASLLHIDNGAVSIPDLDRLAKFSDFDPTYLSLFKQPR